MSKPSLAMGKKLGGYQVLINIVKQVDVEGCGQSGVFLTEDLVCYQVDNRVICKLTMGLGWGQILTLTLGLSSSVEN